MCVCVWELLPRNHHLGISWLPSTEIGSAFNLFWWPPVRALMVGTGEASSWKFGCCDSEQPLDKDCMSHGFRKLKCLVEVHKLADLQ